jgi:hypothetical protein
VLWQGTTPPLFACHRHEWLERASIVEQLLSDVGLVGNQLAAFEGNLISHVSNRKLRINASPGASISYIVLPRNGREA